MSVRQGVFRRGFVPECDGRMCGPQQEGAAFKCNKYGCPIEFVVMWGFVWAVEPDDMLRFAHRGRDHTVSHRCEHHDFPCNMMRNGRRSIHQVVAKENEKARRIFSQISASTDAVLEKFSLCAHRLIDILPQTENNKVLHLGSPTLHLEEPRQFVPIKDTASAEDCEEAWLQNRERPCQAKSRLKLLVRALHFVRCLRSQLGSQRLGGHMRCVEHVLAFLGRKSLLPQISGFACQEVNAPPVTQEVQHAEPPAAIDGQVASMNVEHKLADNVIILNQRSGTAEQLERIYLIEYNRHPEAFRAALCEGAPLQQCRVELEEARRQGLRASQPVRRGLG